MQQKYCSTKQELWVTEEILKEIKGMHWGHQILVYTDHTNVMHDALGPTSDQVYCWRLLLEVYGPTTMYIKGIHKTVADALLQLDCGPITHCRWQVKMDNLCTMLVLPQLST